MLLQVVPDQIYDLILEKESSQWLVLLIEVINGKISSVEVMQCQMKWEDSKGLEGDFDVFECTLTFCWKC